MKKKKTISNQNELFKFTKDHTIKIKNNSKISFIEPLSLDSNIIFEGKITLGKNNKIGPNCFLKNVKIGNNNLIKMSSLIENSSLNNKNIIGPYAFLRDTTKIDDSCIIGAYVEITRSNIKNKSMISHRAFIGDAKIGSNTIIGAGVVFCNYNFSSDKKSKSIIGSKCKIGSNSTLIAPLKLKSNSIVPASFKLKQKLIKKL